MIQPPQVQGTQASGANGSNTSSASNSNIIPAKGEQMSAQMLQINAARSIPGLANPIALQVSGQQAQLLGQQNLFISLQQQSASLFIQSNLVQHQLKLNPALMSQISRFLTANKQPKDLANLPAGLVAALASELGLTEDKLKSRLVNLSLQQSLLQLSLLTGEPIKELQLSSGATKLEPEQLANLLQFLLPIPHNDKANLVVREQKPSQPKDSGDNHFQFELNFDLDQAGHLLIKVALQGFSLVTECVCSQQHLEQKVRQFWPQLEQRFNKLGFQTTNKIIFQIPEQQSDKKPRSSGLVDIKV